MTVLRKMAAAAALTAVLTAGAGCGKSAGDSSAAGGKVKISVNGLPGNDNPAGRKEFLAQVSAFEAKNPDIDLEPVEWTWDARTFTAQLAGGDLPTSFQAPFTESGGLIARHQIKDLTKWVEASPKLKSILPTMLDAVKGTDGHYYAIPTFATQNGILIHRGLFTKAGLNPDQPFGSWDELAQAAQKITQATGKAGYCQLTKQNQGGWILTSIIAAMGNELETKDGDKFTANVDSPGAHAALEFLRKVRWDYNAAGSNFLIDFTALAPDFAAGRCGIMVGPDGWLGEFVTKNKMNPKDFGMFPMPQTANGLGGLGGGTLSVLRADATDAQVDAAVKWLEFRFLDQYYDTKTAADLAKAQAADGNPVPGTFYAIVNQQAYQPYLEAIKPYINVPVANVRTYVDATRKLPVVSEPPIEAQQLYALLDTVIQAVLTRKDADIDALLKQAQSQATTILATAQR
ncbi:ABC transporter substrate-binding protein [Kribbella sp. GL6]|uniref:ABC transporter substrate-binding protein n=1 Tax=Kribbella sp. GL6 TaxID=3419765 RepID=UPI003CFC82B8